LKPPLYERVALTRNPEEHGLRKGDIGVLVDYIPHPKGGEEGALLEVFNALGESVAVIAVQASDTEPDEGRRGACRAPFGESLTAQELPEVNHGQTRSRYGRSPGKDRD
jgi:hypothetical protein